MTGCAVPRWRTLPFGEHRNFAAVLETERLAKLARRGQLAGHEARRLYSLQSRATEPSYRDEPPPAA